MKRVSFIRRYAIFVVAIIFCLTLTHPVNASYNVRVILGDATPRTAITASFPGATGFGADVYLQPCSLSITTDCIRSVAYQVPGSAQWMNLVQDPKIVFPAAGVPRIYSNPSTVTEILTAYPADSARNLPAGGMSPVYMAANTSGDTGVRYLVNVRATGSLNSSKSVAWNNLRIEVRPVSILDYSTLNTFGFPTLKPILTFGNVSKFKIQIQSQMTQNLFSGWFYGRVAEPEILISTINATEKLVEINGSPHTTYASMGDIPLADYDDVKNAMGGNFPSAPPANSVSFFEPTYGFINGLGAMKLWRLVSPLSQDKAVSSMEVFTLGTSKNTAVLKDYYPAGCQESQGFDGVVTTNATMYNPSPPIYESKDQSLVFEVGSPHLDLNGNAIKGSYSLVLRDEIAKCIWGSDLTNYRASVSIVGDKGEAVLSTSTLKLLNGFYYFQISGFTFSTKKIAISLAPAPQVTPTSQPTPTASAKPVVKKITCVKGKLKKVVSGVKPVCPKGYKLK
jgi:hypothetical protein